MDLYNTRVEYIVTPDTVPQDPTAPRTREAGRVTYVLRSDMAHLVQVHVQQKNTPPLGYKAPKENARP